MPKALPNFTLDDYRRMISEAKEPKDIGAVLVLAMAAWSKKKLHNLAMADILSKAADAVMNFN